MRAVETFGMRLPQSDLCFRTITLETGLGGGSSESKPTIWEEMTAIQVRWSRLDLGRRWRWSEGGGYERDFKGRTDTTLEELMLGLRGGIKEEIQVFGGTWVG